MKKHFKKVVFGALAVTLVATSVAITKNGADSTKTTKQQMVVENTNKTGITMHYKWDGDTPHLYYANTDSVGVTSMSYPGVPMNEEGNGWYSYTIEDAKSADMVISIPSKGYETSTFNRTSGEYWYDENRGWFTENPDAEQAEAGGVIQVDTEAAQVAAKEGITVHFVSDWSSANIYYWNALPKDKETAWPGEEMKKDSNGYYTYEFSDVSKINLLFTNGSEQTEDLTLKAGEWWYSNGEWTKYDPANAPTKKPTATAAPFDKRDFREETIYFAMTTRFYDGDPSNNRYCWDDEMYLKSETLNDPGWRGDFKGLIEKLDYIKALGFSAIWITPVVENASGLDYHGYHAYDFSKVDPRYESADCTYQDLINAAHAKDMRIVQDIVLNHTGNWGEKNIFHMFNKDVDDGKSTKSAFMSVATDGDEADKLQKGVEAFGGGAANYDAISDLNVDDKAKGGFQYQSRLGAMKEDNIDTDRIYHHEKQIQWEGYSVQTGQMAGDCVDINTENPKVAAYLRECYINYINMGVDAFRVDTVKHISRLTFNNEFIPQFREAGGENFFMFGEACVRRHETINAGIAPISVCFYTWAEDKDYGWDDTLTNEGLVKKHYEDYMKAGVPKSDNAFLNGNEYHTPDRSKASYFEQIDFRMHWAFKDAGSAFSAAKDEDPFFNDSTYNVTYVDSHDYAPDTAPENQRFAGSQTTWAENLSLMFTFRGIPCIYYGSEIEFQKGKNIDPMVGSNGAPGSGTPYKDSGRAYFGDHIEGSVNTTGFAEYNGATGAMAETLNHDLAKHIQRLNLIRRAVPALQKGQYSTEGCNGGISFKRRYTADGVDSFVCVTISNGATFSGVPSGTYVDMVTGDTVQCDGTLTANCSGQGNMRVYVLQTDGAPSGKIGEDGKYLK